MIPSHEQRDGSWTDEMGRESKPVQAEKIYKKRRNRSKIKIK